LTDGKHYLNAVFLIGATFMLSACTDLSRDPVRIVGSSTIFPFASKTAEVFSDKTGVAVVVEQTGSGGGHKLFCSGNPNIDATTSSRPQKPSETALCEQNGVSPIIEVKLGFDGVVMARAVGGPDFQLDQSVIYHALAKELPQSAATCDPIPNPYTRWSEIDPTLPDVEIEVYGPPPTSGTRDAFVETAMEAGARLFPCLATMEEEAPNLFRARAHTLREDGHWIDAGENDNAMIRTLANAPSAIGVFGFSFLDQNIGRVEGIAVENVLPTADTIRSGAYPVVRGLYLYFRGEGDTDILRYALEFTSEDAMGTHGYLQAIGLIPLSTLDHDDVREMLLTVQSSP
jgi:phosphate transport system substrate-binding protein